MKIAKLVFWYTCLVMSSLVLVIEQSYARSRLKKRESKSVLGPNVSMVNVIPGSSQSQQSVLNAKLEKQRARKAGNIGNAIQDTATSQVEDVTGAAFDTEDIVLPLELQPGKRKSAEEQEVLLAMLEKEEEEKIELQFENASIKNMVSQIEAIFGYTFLYDEMIQPQTKQGAKPFLDTTKISFKTHKPLSKREVWQIFTTFLDIANVTVIPQPTPNFYRIQSIDAAQKAPLPVYIGTDPKDLPSTDELVRYVYFVENTDLETIASVIDGLRSPASKASLALKDQKAIILTDKSYNIKKLMEIVTELDKVNAPQAMSVLKLRRADAKDVEDLYKSLLQSPQEAPQILGPRKIPTMTYFPENMQIISEPRTNSLILLGNYDAIKKIEEFILKYIDVDIDQAYSSLFIYPLKFADAAAVVEILNKVTNFGKETPAGKSGGVRGQDQYLKTMNFVADKEENRVIIKADYDDYLMVKEVIDELDEAQPQVAIDVLVLSITAESAKELGTQLRSKNGTGIEGLLGQNIKFQTSGLRAGGPAQGIVTNPNGAGVQRLLGNLLNLVTNAPAGNTVLTLGQDLVDGMLSVWGIFQMLQTLVNTQVIANPFLIATNKSTAKVSVGQTRRVITSFVIGTDSNQNRNAFDDDPANLTVEFTPQINSDGMVVMDMNINFDEFTDQNNPNSGTKIMRKIKTQVTVANEEIIALGGLIRDDTEDNVTKTPLLGDIPILGWLFKNKRKEVSKSNLLILISTRIIEPDNIDAVQRYTDNRIAEYNGTRYTMDDQHNKRDAVSRWFFQGADSSLPDLGEFIFNRNVHNKGGHTENDKSQPPYLQHEIKNSVPSVISQETVSPSMVVATISKQKRIGGKKSRLKNKKRRSAAPLSSFLSSPEKGMRA